MRRATTITAFIVWMIYLTVSLASGAERFHQLPTATEVFQLRSQCAKLGEQMLQDIFIGSALTEDQLSHYEPRTNRCYVEVTVRTVDLTKPNPYINRTLYDGQTKELLAFARTEKGVKSGMVFDRQGPSTNPTKNLGWEDASAYIDEKMLDDRH
jgi:hypothetical protein